MHAADESFRAHLGTLSHSATAVETITIHSESLYGEAFTLAMHATVRPAGQPATAPQQTSSSPWTTGAWP